MVDRIPSAAGGKATMLFIIMTIKERSADYECCR